MAEAVQRCSVKKGLLKISKNSQKSTCDTVSFLKGLHSEACSVIKKETLAEVFSCKFWGNFGTILFIEHLRWLLLDKTQHFGLILHIIFNNSI